MPDSPVSTPFRPHRLVFPLSIPRSPFSLSPPLSCVPCSISLGQFKLVIPLATHRHLVPECRYAKNQLRRRDATCQRCARITAVFSAGMKLNDTGDGRMMYRMYVRARREIPNRDRTYACASRASEDLSPPRNGFIGVLSVSFSLRPLERRAGITAGRAIREKFPREVRIFFFSLWVLRKSRGTTSSRLVCAKSRKLLDSHLRSLPGKSLRENLSRRKSDSAGTTRD